MQTVSSNGAELFAQKFNNWLETAGLQFNPFDRAYLDSGADANLHAYLIGHDAFQSIWRDVPSFVFAPVGGGKTAFRVRLSRACRVEENGRHVFPIVYKMVSPSRLKSDPAEQHFRQLTRSIASELLLMLAYRPERYFTLSPDKKSLVCQQLQTSHSPNILLTLQQLIDQGNINSLVETVDPTADQLFAQPDSELLRELCLNILQEIDAVEQSNRKKNKATPSELFESLIDTLHSVFHFESVYILIDSIDAHIETISKPASISRWLAPIIEQTPTWAEQRIYTKFFLPDTFASSVKISDLLVSEITTVVNIRWTAERLDSVLRGRILVASDGRFDNLDALCSPALRDVHQKLLKIAKPLPREVMILTGQLLLEHVRRAEEPDMLEPEDLERAEVWYTEDLNRRSGGK